MKKYLIIILMILLVYSFNSNVLARTHEAEFDKLSEYFSTQTTCHGDDYGCRQRAEYKFYLKMYDLYYLYLTKYDVELDLPLLMATLYYNNDQMNVVFKMYFPFLNIKLYQNKSACENVFICFSRFSGLLYDVFLTYRTFQMLLSN